MIECFDAFAPQNIAACLYLQPEALIFLGDRAQIEPYLPRYRTLLAHRSPETRLTCRYVAMDDLADIVRELKDLLRPDDDYVIDIDGGDERILVAAGAVLAGLDQHKRSRITLQQFDPLSGTVTSLGSGAHPQGLPVRLGVQELVQLQGGILHPDTPQPARQCTADDLDGLWNLVQRDNRSWNRIIGILREFESRADSDTQVFLPLPAVRGSIPNFDSKLAQVRRLLAQLAQCGAVRDHSKPDYLDYSYTSPLMRACTRKAGNALEHKVLLEARDLHVEGQPYFHDCHMGAQIDWDGVVHHPAQRIPETRNEVDLILVRGMVPLFVSCKNGDIGEAELYKLHTVASLFGGPYARKMLIATDLDSKKPGSSGALIQRARDMGIYLVTDAATLTKQGWAMTFQKAMERPNAVG